MKLIANLSELDQKTVSQTGISVAQLMESAGESIAKQVVAHCKPEQVGLILCGPGNNGSDGFVCARKLFAAGYRKLTVIYTGNAYRNEALANLEQLMISFPGALVDAKTQTELALHRIGEAEFIIDALFGSGLSRPLEGLEARIIEAANQQRLAKSTWMLAVDLPSGINSLTGQVWDCAMQADATVTFAVAKPGLYLQPGKTHAGKIIQADIGIPAGLIEEEESPFRLITTAMAKSWLPGRLPDSHKYHYGSVLVLAGSRNMPGAAILCSEAAMRAGTGLVTLAAPASVFQQMQLMPEIMRVSLPDADFITSDSLNSLQAALASGKYNTLALGPGLGRDAATVKVILELLAHLTTLELAVVVDADALAALSTTSMMLNERFILTPHVGEAARLLDMESANVTADLPNAAIRLQNKTGANVVLKSASTLIVEANTQQPLAGNGLVWISPTGNPGMATAGSGDVLTGVIAAMAAQSRAGKQKDLNSWQAGEAAALGVYLHGLAGDSAADAVTAYCMHASLIIEHLPQAFRQVVNS
jgi:hydroxyethylthiazole kinase-like uncharacterized protein yjeF